MYIQFHVLKFGIQLNYMELICMGTFVLVIWNVFTSELNGEENGKTKKKS